VRLRQRPPALGRLAQEVADVEHVHPLARATAAGSRGEVVERDARAAQLQVDGGDTRRRLPVRRQRVQRQPRGEQRPAQLVARLGDERKPPTLARLARGHRGERRDPAEHRKPRRHAAASASTGPSTRR
jgi:hypothetical protein